MLLPLLLGACTGSQAPAPIAIPFAAQAGGQPVVCGQPLALPDGTALTVTDLRLYLHDLEVVDTDGHAHPVALDPGPWQTAQVALLDLEDGCLNGSAPTHTTLTGTVPVPAARQAALRFKVGVPFAENHADPSAAQGPLAMTALHWTWQAGYKFLRLDFSRDGTAAHVHLGSTGCDGTVGHISGCARPNRPTAEVPLGRTAVLDVAALANPAGCMAEADDPGCASVFFALGLDLQSGMSSQPAPAFSAP